MEIPTASATTLPLLLPALLGMVLITGSPMAMSLEVGGLVECFSAVAARWMLLASLAGSVWRTCAAAAAEFASLAEAIATKVT